MIPFGELAPDVADLNTSVSSVANNVIPAVNSYNPLPGLAAYSDALDNPCQGAVSMQDSDQNKYIFTGDKTKLYSISDTTVTTENSGYTDNTNSWNFLKWGEKVIASKFGDTPQILTLGSSTFAALSGSPPQCKTLTTIKNFIVMGNTYDTTDGNVNHRVRWSGFEDETQWTVGTNQSDFQDLEGKGGEIKRIIGGEVGIVFQSRSIWRMSYVGTPLVFEFDEVAAGLGTPSGGSVVQHGENIYYLAQDGFYVLRNGTNSESIGINKVDKWFLANVNQSYLDNISGSISPEAGFVVWAYPSKSSIDGSLDSIIAYNFKSGRWGTGTIDTQLIFQGATSSYTLEQLDAFGTVDTINSSFDSNVWKGGAFQLAAFDSDNKLAFFSGDALPATIETGEISTDGHKTQLSSVRPIVDGDCTVKISTRDHLSNSPVEGLDTTLDASGKANFRTNKRYHRISITTTGNFTHASGVEVVTKNRGTR